MSIYNKKTHPMTSEIERFLKNPLILIKMKTAISLNHAPVDGIQEDLYIKFFIFIDDKIFIEAVNYRIEIIFSEMGYKKKAHRCACKNPLFVTISRKFFYKNSLDEIINRGE